MAAGRSRLARLLGGAALAALLAMAAQPAAAERHALLVAVNEYPDLPKTKWLSGPSNDAAHVVEFLTSTPALGFARERITVLSNGGGASDGVPDRAGIRAALDRLAEQAEPGDFVYIHFAGHGSTQKARDLASEPDGLDEVFLPADTRMPENGIYPNALVDNEIGAHLDRIRNAGAFAFVIFDACNSASATRVAGPAGADAGTRFLPSAVEGASIVETEERLPPIASDDAGLKSGAGGMVAFFAAQTTEETPELMLPRNSAAQRRMGLFTHTIYDVLARSARGLTYRQLADGVMHAYAVGNRMKPTPLFEGELDLPVFDVEGAEPVLQWPVTVAPAGSRVPAGSVHGLADGAKLALLADPLDTIEQALGYVEARDVGAFSARLWPVAHAGLPAPRMVNLPAGAVARPVELPLEFELTVALPDDRATRHGDAARAVRATLERLAGDGSVPVNLRTVAPGEAADLRLAVLSRDELFPGTGADDEPRLWFLAPDGRLPDDPRLTPHSVSAAGGLEGEALAQARENLAAVFRATSLSRLAAMSSLGGDRIGIDFSLARTGAAEPEALESSRSPLVRPGDIVQVSIANGQASAVDVDILLVGPSYSIQHLLGRRFLKGEKLSPPIAQVSAHAFGTRRLILVAREASPGTDYRSLAFLEQVGTQTRASPPAGARDLDQMIEDIARGPGKRGAGRLASGAAPKGLLRVISFESMPD
jgi:hypothetical protein